MFRFSSWERVRSWLGCKLSPFNFEKPILSQQLSTSAARTIRLRLEDLAGELTVESVANLPAKSLHSVGVSKQKTNCILSLSEKVLSNEICLRTIGRKTDDRIIESLTVVKGIGTWTAQMFLIFSLGRMNITPLDDLGVRRAIQLKYGFDGLPDKKTFQRIAANWEPYSSIGSWYCWQYLDNPKRI